VCSNVNIYGGTSVQRALPIIFQGLISAAVEVPILREMVEVLQGTAKPARNKMTSFIGRQSVRSTRRKLRRPTTSLRWVACEVAFDTRGPALRIEGVRVAIFDYRLGNAPGFCSIPDNIICGPSSVTGEISDSPGILRDGGSCLADVPG
jgi:hypothetical protein